MAVPRSTSLLFRFLCFAGVMALALGLSATSGQARSRAGVTAAPATSQQALAQLRTFNRQLEKVTEQYNEARVLLGKRTARARAATARARAAAKTVAAHQARIRRLVQAENRADRPGTAGSGQSSRPPGRFAGKVRVTDTIATRHASVLAKARRASAAAAKAARQARAAVAAAAKLARQLAAKRRDLGRRAAQSKAMFDRLSAAERRALAGNAVAAPGGSARARGAAAVAVR